MKIMTKDYLTGLLSRQGLYEWYDSLSEPCTLQFMLMDLDNFKNVNDTYGHGVGDELLKAIAPILYKWAEDGTCVRLGGDEFVVILSGEHSREELSSVADGIIKSIREKEGFSHISTDVSASIGILMGEKSDHPLNSIIPKVDIAMYRAKNLGRACYVFFNDIAEEVYNENQMEHRQEDALQNKEFQVYLRPIISPQSSMLFMTEAYLIWKEPGGKIRMQEEFLPLFERNGFITYLDYWLIEEVCKLIEELHRVQHVKADICILISKLLLLNHNFSGWLMEMVAKYGVEAKELYFMIDESGFSRGSGDMVCTLHSLTEMGFGIAVTEVGINFNSIRYWDRLSLTFIRLNAGYLKRAIQNPRGRQIIKTLISMGHDLKMKVVANGIESREDMLFLSGCGCNAICGPLYSSPLPKEEYDEYIIDKIAENEQKVEFHFLGDFISADGKYEGRVIGSGVELEKGISSQWGSLYFPGGEVMCNVLELPREIISGESYAVAMWLKPITENAWTSSFYARFAGGFSSFVPFAGSGTSCFRISEDADAHGFSDILSRQIQLNKWNFVCITYDVGTGVSRSYINGRKTGYTKDVPWFSVCKNILLGGDPFQKSYNGYLSGLIFYNRAKDETEVKELYNEFVESQGFCGERESFWMEDGD